MKKVFLLVNVIGIAVMLFSGCVTLGRPLPEDITGDICIGKTTRTEIEEKLGDPFRTGVDSGDPTATYLHYKIGLFTEPVTTDLKIVYSSAGIVKSFVFDSNQMPAEE
jgi:hypothetical protein